MELSDSIVKVLVKGLLTAILDRLAPLFTARGVDLEDIEAWAVDKAVDAFKKATAPEPTQDPETERDPDAQAE